MQLDAARVAREAVRLLPDLIDELFDHEGEPFRFEASEDPGLDLLASNRGRTWVFEVKRSSSPGLVAAAAESLQRLLPDATKVLVVPFMTPAGEKAASAARLNWIDLCGNADIRDDQLYISVRGRPNRYVARGRPSSPFAPKSARITRTMLLDPERWWRQQQLSTTTDLNSGQVSRVVKRLLEDNLLETNGPWVRPRDAEALLDAWEDHYRFDRHQVLRCHMSGAGIELARSLEGRLEDLEGRHAFTGLAAAWAMRGFARFRLNSVYVDRDPHEVADDLGLRVNERGANVQLIFPEDSGVFTGTRMIKGLSCVAPVQAYLDLKHLPERAAEAAQDLRERGLWDGS